MEKEYDCFISHASEDKDDFVRELAECLKDSGLKVWYDEFTIRAGNSLRKEIDKGLSSSIAGIVIFSHNFFEKEWTQNELNALVARKNATKKDLIIPIWYNIGYNDIIKVSPTCADMYALDSKEGVSVITEKILSIITELKNDGNSSIPILEKNNAKRQYMETIVTPWSEMIDINNWNSWTYGLLSSGQPTLSSEKLEQLNKTIKYLMGRIWDENFDEVNKAFINFLSVLQDLYLSFTQRASEEFGTMVFQKFYKNASDYEQAHKQYEFEVYLIEDLVIELTRAANYICDQVRKYIEPEFMIKNGYLLITSGPNINLQEETTKVTYNETDIDLYPGRDSFLTIRKERNYHMGVGTSIEDPVFLDWYNS